MIIYFKLKYKECSILDVTPCGSCKNRCFGGTYRLHYQVGKNRRSGTRLKVTIKRRKRMEGLGKLKTFNDLIGTRSRIVSQPFIPTVSCFSFIIYLNWTLSLQRQWDYFFSKLCKFKFILKNLNFATALSSRYVTHHEALHLHAARIRRKNGRGLETF
jgi:hypothetical protein